MELFTPQWEFKSSRGPTVANCRPNQGLVPFRKMGRTGARPFMRIPVRVKVT